MTLVLVDVVEVRVIDERRLYLRFEDGAAGEVDLDRLVRWEGVFEPLRDPQRFAEVRVDPDLGTIVWPNGADIDPDVLYSAVTGTSIVVAASPTGR
jgi:hypothetical protein